MDNKTIVAVLVLAVIAYLGFKLLKALIPLIFIGAAAFFTWRWYKSR